MTWHAPCRSDPLLEWLRKTFLAHPLRVPSARVTPLVAFSRANGKFAILGDVEDFLLEPAKAELRQLEWDCGPVPNVALQRSRHVDTSLGLDILAGLLSGMGLPIVPDALSAQIAPYQSLAFFLTEAKQVWVDASALGNVLTGLVVKVDNTALRPALRSPDPADLFLIDTVFVSRSFGISTKSGRSAAGKLKVEPILAALGSATASVTVDQRDESELLFEHDSYLTFAFTCLRVTLTEQEGVLLLTPYRERVDLARPRARDDRPVRRSLLTSDLGLLEWDEPDPTDLSG